MRCRGRENSRKRSRFMQDRVRSWARTMRPPLCVQALMRGGWRGFVLDFEKKDWLAPDFRAKYITACRLASIGENQMALDQLEHAFADREGFITLINVDPRLDPLRDEPRFKELLKKIGFPER